MKKSELNLQANRLAYQYLESMFDNPFLIEENLPGLTEKEKQYVVSYLDKIVQKQYNKCMVRNK